MKKAGKIKKLLMTQLWRYQQSQAFYSVIFWSLALAGIFYERSQYYFGKYLGLSDNPDEQVIFKMGILVILVFAVIVLFGFLYDIIFRLWEQQSDILSERNVYTHYKIQVNWLIIYKRLFLPLLRSSNTDGELDERIAFIERWTDKLLQEDPVVKLYYDHVSNWVLSDEKDWRPPPMEKLLAAYNRKEHIMEGVSE